VRAISLNGFALENRSGQCNDETLRQFEVALLHRNPEKKFLLPRCG
jgi:hypothetical protein